MAEETSPVLRRIVNRGGPGSGHFGHAGRPGERGGSVPSGGLGAPAPVSEADRTHLNSIRQMEGMYRGNRTNYTLILEHGRYFTPAERPADVPKMPDKECYENATQLALRRPDLTYVEGFATIPEVEGLPFAHAWLVDDKGTVIDPTWGRPGTSYFGIPFTDDYLRQTLVREKMYGMLPDMPRKNYNPARDGFPEGAIKR